MKRFIFRPDNRQQILQVIANYLSAQGDAALPLEVVVKPYKSNRSIMQNDLYWTLVSAIANDTGHSRDEIHDLCRYRFLGMRSKEVAGVKIEYLPSTTKLKVAEMSDYFTQCEAWAAGIGVYLPPRGYE